MPDVPENFLTPRRLPGDPPWLWTVPPALFVAVRIAPPAAGSTQKGEQVFEVGYLGEKRDFVLRYNTVSEKTSTQKQQSVTEA